jgi:hypothetical protein
LPKYFKCHGIQCPLRQRHELSPVISLSFLDVYDFLPQVSRIVLLCVHTCEQEVWEKFSPVVRKIMENSVFFTPPIFWSGKITVLWKSRDHLITIIISTNDRHKIMWLLSWCKLLRILQILHDNLVTSLSFPYGHQTTIY